MVSDKRYRTEMPNIIDDLGLDPYERALYVHYRRVCGAASEGGYCNEGVRATSDKTKIAVGKVAKVRESLKERGLIETAGGGLGQGGRTTVTIVNIWDINAAFYAADDRPDIDGWTVKRLIEWSTNVHHVNIERSPDEQLTAECSPRERNVQDVNIECSPRELKKEPIKKEPIKNLKDISGKPQKPPNEKTYSPKQKMIIALASVCRIDLSMATDKMFGQIGQTANKLEKSGRTPEQIDDFGKWWYANDWRGEQDQPPIPSQILEAWGNFEHWIKAGRPAKEQLKNGQNGTYSRKRKTTGEAPDIGPQLPPIAVISIG